MHGAGLVVDLRRFFGVELESVIRGDGPAPCVVNTLIAGLPDTSLTVALETGGMEHYGWGYDRHLAVSSLEQLILRRMDGSKNSKFKPLYRPETKSKQTPKNKILDFFSKFQDAGPGSD